MQLAFQRCGEGFPLIILHGLFGSLDNWQTISRKLGETQQVFAVDLRNHGRSPHSEIFDYAAMAGDLREFMSDHGLASANVLGHSMGGKAAMHFALLHPELVAKLIVVDIAPKSYPPAHLPLFDAMFALNLNSYRERSEIAEALAPSIPDPATRQFLLKNVARDSDGKFRWKLNLPVIRRNYDLLNREIESARTFDGPVLFVKGERSDYLAEGDMTLIHRLFTRATVKTIAGAGHWVHADAPDAFVRIIQRFLGARSAAPPSAFQAMDLL